jgi:hypothetical protein
MCNSGKHVGRSSIASSINFDQHGSHIRKNGSWRWFSIAIHANISRLPSGNLIRISVESSTLAIDTFAICTPIDILSRVQLVLIIGEHISVKLVIASGVIERIFWVIGGSEFLLSAQGDGKRNNTVANVSIRSGVEDLVVVRLEDAFIPLSVKISSINVGEEVSAEFLERRYLELWINS